MECRVCHEMQGEQHVIVVVVVVAVVIILPTIPSGDKTRCYTILYYIMLFYRCTRYKHHTVLYPTLRCDKIRYVALYSRLRYSTATVLYSMSLCCTIGCTVPCTSGYGMVSCCAVLLRVACSLHLYIFLVELLSVDCIPCNIYRGT